MCPMCERRAQLLLRQQQHQQQHAAVVESSLGTSSASLKPPEVHGSHNRNSLFRNPFQSCKNLSHQCCSPVCESHRTSLHSLRRSSVRPSLTPDHSGEIAYLHSGEYRVYHSPYYGDSSFKENQQLVVRRVSPNPIPNPKTGQGSKKAQGLLTRLKQLTHGAASQSEIRSGSADSSFTACGRKVLAVVDSPDHVRRASTVSPPFEPSLDTTSEVSLSVTETNVSETTMISMRNLNGSLSSLSYRGSTLKSSAYDDDASTFAIIPCTSAYSEDWTSDASGLSDGFGEFDIGYSSLDEGGEGPDFDDTVSISSLQGEDLDPIEPLLESDVDQDYSIDTDSQEWCTEVEEAPFPWQWTRGTSSKNHLHLVLPDLETTPPQELTAFSHELTSLPRHNSFAEEDFRQGPDEESELSEETATMEVMKLIEERAKPAKYLCSRCGRTEKKVPELANAQTTKKVTQKQNPMNAYFSTVIDGEDQAVVAAKVVVLLGKYGNRRGLRVAGSHSRRNLRTK